MSEHKNVEMLFEVEPGLTIDSGYFQDDLNALFQYDETGATVPTGCPCVIEGEFWLYQDGELILDTNGYTSDFFYLDDDGRVVLGRPLIGG